MLVRRPIVDLLARAALGCLLLLAPLGCSYGISVRRASGPHILDAWRANVGEADALSPRTLQTLRSCDLEHDYQRDPLQAYTRLQLAANNDADSDLLFALAEISHHMARHAEKRDANVAAGYYYLCAGYAYHFLFSHSTPASAWPVQESMDAFDPRFRLACDLYNTGLAKCIAGAQKMGRLDPRQQLQLPTADGKGFRLSVVHHGFPWQPDEFGSLLLCADYQVVGLPNHYRGYGLGVALIGIRDHELQERDNALARGSKARRVRAASEDDTAIHSGPGSYPPGLRSTSDPATRTCASGTTVKSVQLAANARPGRSSGRYPREVSFPVSAFLRFEGTVADLGTHRSGRLELYNPLAVQTVKVQSRVVPLEADLTTPLAYFLSRTDLDGIEYTGFLHADKILDRAGIYMFEPYQPGKIPVLMVHGWLSSPLTWTTLFNDLRADPKLRERYQFWFYLYPSGNPYLATAADLRQELSQLRADLDPHHQDAALDHMVLVGHSMGGLVSRLLTVQSRDDFWALVSPKPVENLKVGGDTRAELRRLFYFEKTPGIERVIFLGTPHHGSRLGPSAPARLAARFMYAPQRILKIVGEITKTDPEAPAMLRDGRIASSLDLLAPGAPGLELLAARPIPEHVHFHSIIGEAFGQGASGSDGAVLYTSAHVDGVDSEVVIPAHHMALQHHPRAVFEVRRILTEHLREVQTMPGLQTPPAPYTPPPPTLLDVIGVLPTF